MRRKIREARSEFVKNGNQANEENEFRRFVADYRDMTSIVIVLVQVIDRPSPAQLTKAGTVRTAIFCINLTHAFWNLLPNFAFYTTLVTA